MSWFRRAHLAIGRIVPWVVERTMAGLRRVAPQRVLARKREA